MSKQKSVARFYKSTEVKKMLQIAVINESNGNRIGGRSADDARLSTAVEQ